MNKPKVSIIIVSYNTKDLLKNCLDSIVENAKLSYEIIISDNGSNDGTIEFLNSKTIKYKNLTVIENKQNLGFAKANNIAAQASIGEYILFLNPDTLLHKETLQQTVFYLEKHKNVGALTCRVNLLDGSLDKDTRRSFPTPFIALTHFSGIDRLFPQSKLFAKYWYGFLPEDKEHYIESLQGAYLLGRRDILEKVKYFDEDYFLDGEDIDLCYKIYEAGYLIVYYPSVSITHIKKGSKSKNRSLRSIVGGVKAMEIFYRKRLWSKYPFFINFFVIFGIRLLIILRTIKYYLIKI